MAVVSTRRFLFLALLYEDAHIAKFVSGIWQIHAFREGNTRATPVFTIKYLRSMGFSVDNELFREHSWYFRNALVRANYRNVRKGIEPDPEFLERFFRNLLAGEHNELKNRFMLIDPPEQLADKHPTSIRQVPHKYPTSCLADPRRYGNCSKPLVKNRVPSGR